MAKLAVFLAAVLLAQVAQAQNFCVVPAKLQSSSQAKVGGSLQAPIAAVIKPNQAASFIGNIGIVFPQGEQARCDAHCGSGGALWGAQQLDRTRAAPPNAPPGLVPWSCSEAAAALPARPAQAHLQTLIPDNRGRHLLRSHVPHARHPACGAGQGLPVHTQGLAGRERYPRHRDRGDWQHACGHRVPDRPAG